MTDKVSALHILVDHEHEAQDCLKKIEDGTEFESVAREFSNCPSGKDGGNLGEFGRGVMVSEFEKAAFELEVGQVSGPVKTQFGFHLIKRTN